MIVTYEENRNFATEPENVARLNETNTHLEYYYSDIFGNIQFTDLVAYMKEKFDTETLKQWSQHLNNLKGTTMAGEHVYTITKCDMLIDLENAIDDIIEEREMEFAKHDHGCFKWLKNEFKTNIDGNIREVKK